MARKSTAQRSLICWVLKTVSRWQSSKSLIHVTEQKIEFVDLRRQYRNLKPEIDAAVLHALGRGDYILGEDTREFEKEFASFVGANYCVGVSDGTDALHLALLALGIGPGDEVIVPANTF